MRFNFKKVSAVTASMLMTGMTMGVAAAANYPEPFVKNNVADVAIVYGSGAAQTDVVAATNIQTALQGEISGTSSGSVSTTAEVSEDEVVLGGYVNATGTIPRVLTDSKLPGLLDEQISWDDGNGDEDYDVHEEIILDDVRVRTTAYDNDYEELAALTADQDGIEYRFVFDDRIETGFVGNSDADDLYLTILGKTYEVTNMASDSFTVVTSQEVSLGIGESFTYDGTTVSVDDIFSDSASVNGEFIDTGASKSVDGVKVKVESIGYHSNEPTLSKVRLRIGDQISKQYTAGEEYVGEDEDDPTWVWTYSDPNVSNGYIGVKLNKDAEDANDEDSEGNRMVRYPGESFVLPENFAAITFDGLTDVDYEEIMLSFDRQNLYNATATSPGSRDYYAAILEGPNDDTFTVNSQETSKIYIAYAPRGVADVDGDFAVDVNGSIELYYYDDNGDISGVKPRIVQQLIPTIDGNENIVLAYTSIATVEVGDTDATAYLYTKGGGDLRLDINGSNGGVSIDLGGDELISNASSATDGGMLQWLGNISESDDQSNALSTDVLVDGDAIGDEDEDVMNNDGFIVKEPENNADDDEVILHLPDDDVYAEVSVSGPGAVSGGSTGGDKGVMVITDDEVSSYSNKNLILVGGSCINSATASVLGGSYCGAAFEDATGIGSGEFMIKSMADSALTSKIALVVAGYNAADTTNAVTYLNNNDVDTADGSEYEGTSATQATMVVN